MAYTSINKPSDYFNTVLYTGNGSTQSITGVGFQPDWVWQKTRNYDYSHTLADVVRGASLNMFTNNNLGDQTVSNGLTSFDSDGFSVGADLGWNASASDRNSKVAWNWLASNTTASNTDGSITSTVSANTTSGFSIVSYTGTGSASTIGHGLGSAPKMVICKTRSTTGEWITWHTGIDIQAKLSLNTTDAVYNPGTGLYWNSTLPTSSVFSVGTSGSVNSSSTTYIAYCFAEKKGFSKFGSYTGNGSTDGTFVYTGFKPAFIITKCSSTSSSYTHWGIWDNKRDPKNQAQQQLAANISEEENSANIGGQYIDMLSNGFKTKNNGSSHNLSGETYIYMAFAESPFTTSTGVPTTAR